MIMLSGKRKVNFDLYDNVWYVTTTCPGMKVGCEHHPELAASKEAGKLYSIDPKLFYDQYVKELTSEPKVTYLKDVVKRSDAGEWFQFIFYEDDPTDGERPYMYDILKNMTSNVYIE